MNALHSLCAMALSLALTAPLAAEEERLLYSWTSADGIVHYTDDLERIPEEFRANPRTFVAKERTERAPAAAAPATAPASPAKPASKALPIEAYDGWTEAEWRAAAARIDAQLANLAPLVAECANDHVNLSPGDGSRKRREEEEEARRCAEARTGYANAQAEREALSERAHRAGAPPGWVRGE